MPDAGYWILDAGCWVLDIDTGFRRTADGTRQMNSGIL
jgi:hypothetical protein